jgi:Na+/glutamate symporter
MDTQRVPWQVVFTGWVLLVFACIRVVYDLPAFRHAGDQATVFVLASVGYAAIYTVAGIGLVRGRRWGWLLGVLLGLLGFVGGWILVQGWSPFGVPWLVALHLLFTVGIGITIIVCLFSPSAIRWAWRGVAGKRLSPASALGPPA